jgi:hypothetical protein
LISGRSGTPVHHAPLEIYSISSYAHTSSSYVYASPADKDRAESPYYQDFIAKKSHGHGDKH